LIQKIYEQFASHPPKQLPVQLLPQPYRVYFHDYHTRAVQNPAQPIEQLPSQLPSQPEQVSLQDPVQLPAQESSQVSVQLSAQLSVQLSVQVEVQSSSHAASQPSHFSQLITVNPNPNNANPGKTVFDIERKKVLRS